MEKSIWKNPQNEKSLNQSQTPLWFWNDKLYKNELLRQLELMSKAGVTCTIPHARTNMGEGYIGEYLSEEWFNNIGVVLEYKKEHKEPVWLYDEIDWPAGSCNKTITRKEQFREQYLFIQEIKVKAGEVFRTQLKEFNGKSLQEVMANESYEECAFNVYAVDEETGEEYHTWDYFVECMFGPEFEFQSNRNAIIYLIERRADIYDCGGSEQVNYLEKQATQEFLKSTHEKYYERFPEYFGSIIKCVFNDETRMSHALVWCEGFRSEFFKRKGYDITQKLYMLIRLGEKAGRIRCDYYDVVASMYQENYFGILQQWCKEHNIELFAHLLGEETIYGQVRYSGDFLRQGKYLDCVGADHLGKGIGSLNIKFASCAAHSYGKEKTGVEIFAGCGWDLTFEEYIRMITWVYQQGMQCIINHGFFYSVRGKRKDDWPPSEFFQWKEWERMPEGNAMIRRLTYAFTGGKAEADVLIYHPTETFWKYYIPNQRFTTGFFRGAFLQDEKAVKIDRETQMLYNGLLSENIDFDLIHLDAVENFTVSERKIKNRLNGQNFSVLILPMCEVIPLSLAKLCERYAEEGGKLLLLDEIPQIGIRKDEDEEIQKIFHKLCLLDNVSLLYLNNKEKIFKWVEGCVSWPVKIVKGISKNKNFHMFYESHLIDPYIHTGEDISGIMYNRYLKDGKRNTLFMNYGNIEEMIEVCVRSSTIPEIWNTFTGEIRNAQILEHIGDLWTVRMELPCSYGVMLVSDE